MVTQIASYGRPGLIQAARLQMTGARAVTPVAVAPVLRDRPQSSTPQHSASAVAFAPAAMSALIEAQERLAQNAPAPVRRRTADEIDHLVARMEAAADPDLTSASLTVRQLISVRDALSRTSVDIQA